MLSQQASLNTKSYNTAWIEKGKSLEFDYCLAASQEIAEFINSYGYSWWSKEPQDLENCKMEIVDAVHFMLSQSIILEGTIEKAAKQIYVNWLVSMSSLRWKDSNVLETAKLLLARLCIINDRDIQGGADLEESPWVFLFALAKSIGLTLPKLYTLYMAKSLLNAFRQKNHYKKGVFTFGTYSGEDRYLKLWDKVHQDNYFLMKWIEECKVLPSLEDIRLWLEVTYEGYLYDSTKAYKEVYLTSTDAV